MIQHTPKLSTSWTYHTLEDALEIEHHQRSLNIGIPKEDVYPEERVPLTPSAVAVMREEGHAVDIEKGAGVGAGFSDDEYAVAGAKIVKHKNEIFKNEIVVKSAPINTTELEWFQKGQTIISPIHFLSLDKKIIKALMSHKMTAISFENLKDNSGNFPIVRSMSEIAGSALVLLAGEYLNSKHNKGKGVLFGGISGTKPTEMVIIGAGIVAEFATRAALALGARVKIFDNDIYKLKRIQDHIGQRLFTSVIQPQLLLEHLSRCDVAVGAVSSDGGKTPLCVSEQMVMQMKKNSLIIDVSIDRGGCFETSEMTSHKHPTFIKHGVVHYCVPNIPSLYAQTASEAISNVLVNLILNMGYYGSMEQLLINNHNFRNGVYAFKGHSTNPHISKKLLLPFTHLDNLMMDHLN